MKLIVALMLLILAQNSLLSLVGRQWDRLLNSAGPSMPNTEQKMSPRSVMNQKSKEILYKTFIKEFKAWAGSNYDKIISKEDLYVIMWTMGYFGSKHKQIWNMNSFEERSLEYIYRICKQQTENLKTILLWIESLYIPHKQFTERQMSKEKSKMNISWLSKCNPSRVFNFTSARMDCFAASPESHNESTNSLYSTNQYASKRWNSPKSSVIKYDSTGNIVDLPEEYEEFLKRKFSKLVSNRRSNKPYESRNSLKILNKTTSWTTISYTARLNESNISKNKNKENQSCVSKSSTSGVSIGRKRNSIIKTLTKSLVSKEVIKSKPMGLTENKSLANLSTSNNSKLQTPQTCKVKDTSPRLYLNKASKNLFNKVLNQTPKATKMKSIQPVLKPKATKKISKASTKTIQINLGLNDISSASDSTENTVIISAPAAVIENSQADQRDNYDHINYLDDSLDNVQDKENKPIEIIPKTSKKEENKQKII